MGMNQLTSTLQGVPLIDEMVGNLHAGSAADIMQLMPDGCIDQIITSPPYWTAVEYDGDSKIGRASRRERACKSVKFQEGAYDVRISDWSSDVCSSDLAGDVQSLWSDSGRHSTSEATWA